MGHEASAASREQHAFSSAGGRGLHDYVAHLRTYHALFRRLRSFQFVNVSTALSFHNQAAELFSFLVEGTDLSDLTRYFDFQTKVTHVSGLDRKSGAEEFSIAIPQEKSVRQNACCLYEIFKLLKKY